MVKYEGSRKKIIPTVAHVVGPMYTMQYYINSHASRVSYISSRCKIGLISYGSSPAY